MNSPTITGGEDSSTVNRRQPLLRTTTTATPMTTKNIESPHRQRAGEVAGRTAAECATVCCCFPCAVVHFLVLAVYKVPTGLCRKMWRKEKQKKLSNNNKKKKNEPKGAYDNVANEKKCGGGVGGGGGGGKPVVAESETEMWGRLYEGGFFRSASKKKED